MKRSLVKTREEARRLYLTGELQTNAEIAAHLKVKPHTVGRWHREEDWDSLRRKIDRRAAEMFVEKIATDRVTLNARHFKFWDVIGSRLIESVQKGGVDGAEIKKLERLAAVLEKMQKGQRLARGLALDGETEEQIRAEAHAENRHLIDVFIDALKENVKDETTRERVRQAIIEASPHEEDDGTRDNGDEIAH